jgi:hypothetical protein
MQRSLTAFSLYLATYWSLCCALNQLNSVAVLTNKSTGKDSGRPIRSLRDRSPRRPSVAVPSCHRDASKRSSRGVATRKSWNPSALVRLQNPNENAIAFNLASSGLRLVQDRGTKVYANTADPSIAYNLHAPTPETRFRFVSLNELFPHSSAMLGFSETFSTDKHFREQLRNSLRRDLFDANPTHHRLSEKARAILLQPDSSLQSSWSISSSESIPTPTPRTTALLQKTFGSTPHPTEYSIPTGVDLLNAIGSLCGRGASTHWMDIVGINDRAISHSWHQDTGRSGDGESWTVLWGFPKEDCYVGTGVFTHVLPLTHEHHAPHGHTQNEPVLFHGISVPDESIVRPCFGPGKELLVYRDIDVLHSAPDVTYRTSVMRFM